MITREEHFKELYNRFYRSLGFCCNTGEMPGCLSGWSGFHANYSEWLIPNRGKLDRESYYAKRPEIPESERIYPDPRFALFPYKFDRLDQEALRFWDYARENLGPSTAWGPYVPQFLALFCHEVLLDCYNYDFYDGGEFSKLNMFHHWMFQGGCFQSDTGWKPQKEDFEYSVGIILGSAIQNEPCLAAQGFARLTFFSDLSDWMDTRAIRLLDQFYLPCMLSSDDEDLAKLGLNHARCLAAFQVSLGQEDYQLCATDANLMNATTTANAVTKRLRSEIGKLRPPSDPIREMLIASCCEIWLQNVIAQLPDEKRQKIYSRIAKDKFKFAEASDGVKSSLLAAHIVLLDCENGANVPEADISMCFVSFGKAMEIHLKELLCAALESYALPSEVSWQSIAADVLKFKHSHKVNTLQDVVRIMNEGEDKKGNSELTLGRLFKILEYCGVRKFTCGNVKDCPGLLQIQPGEATPLAGNLENIRNGYAHKDTIIATKDVKVKWGQFKDNYVKYFNWACEQKARLKCLGKNGGLK
jgi:hypothetical protein